MSQLARTNDKYQDDQRRALEKKVPLTSLLKGMCQTLDFRHTRDGSWYRSCSVNATFWTV